MKVSAIILAAGSSTRMRTPKVLLKWGSTTVIEQIVLTLQQGGVADVIVVAGEFYDTLMQLFPRNGPLHVVFNSNYQNGSMLTSLQTGLGALLPETEGCLVLLGDQPMVRGETIRMMIQTAEGTDRTVVIPSFDMKRGHPWLLKRTLFSQLSRLPPETILRDFIEEHRDAIQYIDMTSDEVLLDMDTPEEYEKYRPKEE